MLSRSNWKSFRDGWVIAIIVFTIGFTLFLAELFMYGWSLFIVLPVVVGLSAGLLPNKKYSIYGAAIGLIAFFILLLLGHFEGLICLFYTWPLALGGIVIGYFISKAIDRRVKEKSVTVKVFMLPLFIFAFSVGIEHIIVNNDDVEVVSTSMYLPYSPNVVWDHIKSVDTLNTDKPLMLKLGLPVPEKCILNAEAVGAKRTCYFEGGLIEEELTEIRKPELLKMKVTKYELRGSHWLNFKDAIYTFQAKDSGTIITRTTTYTSELQPRFYWRLCEHHAIQSEHEYVLNDLKRRLEELK